MQRYLTVSVRHAGCGWMRHAAVHCDAYILVCMLCIVRVRVCA